MSDVSTDLNEEAAAAALLPGEQLRDTFAKSGSLQI